jgi:CoA:oxalate CoA-transferase
MKRALENIRVLDLSHVLAAPIAAMVLADMGAEVIHIEPPQGDDAREYGPFFGEVDKNHSSYFISLNRNKKGMVLNLKLEEGKEILRDLIKVSDVIIENYKPFTMSSLGLSWDEVKQINPRIIYASISGFGHDTVPENLDKPSYDIAAQAYSGLMSITGPENGPPCRVGSSIGDIIAGHQAVIGILSALFYRTKTGSGQYYDGSMVDGLFSILENAVMRYQATKELPGPLGTAHPDIAPFEAIQTSDGWIVVPIGNNNLWKKFCLAIERNDLFENDLYKNNHLRVSNRKTLSLILNEVLKEKTIKDWAAIFDNIGIPCSPINNIEQIYGDPHIKYRKMLVEMNQPDIGKIQLIGSPIKLSETPGDVYASAPQLGEHTEEILSNILKITPEEISRLRQRGVIN